jgi:hypothetical protein
MRSQPRHSLTRSGTSSLVAAAILLVGHSALAGGRANYVEIAAWDTGYQAQYTITNDGPGDLASWQVVFDLPAGNSISSSWDSVRSGSPQHLVFNNASWNGNLPAGGFTTFGFVVVGLARPAGCLINAGPCDRLPPFAALDLDIVHHGAVLPSSGELDGFRLSERCAAAPVVATAMATRRSSSAT